MKVKMIRGSRHDGEPLKTGKVYDLPEKLAKQLLFSQKATAIVDEKPAGNNDGGDDSNKKQ